MEKDVILACAKLLFETTYIQDPVQNHIAD